jgi:hypothetical protein
MERLTSSDFSTVMPPSVRGSGSLIAWEASAFEELLLSEAAIMTTTRRASPTNAMIPNLFNFVTYI